MTRIALGREFIRDVERGCCAALEEIGFQRFDGIPRIQLTDDALGWVGLNTATSYGDGTMKVNPVVGVIFEPIERLIYEIEGRLSEKKLYPTISQNVGYLSPENTYWGFKFVKGEAVFPRAKEVAESVHLYGLPWMRRHCTIESILDELPNASFPEARSEATCAAYILQRRPREEIERYMRGRMDALTREINGKRIVNQRVQTFFEKARAWMDQGDSRRSD